MYYRSPCLFFRNTVRSASSCFRVRQDHYGARGLWPDHVCARGLWPDHACARGLARPLRALGLLARPRRPRPEQLCRAPTTSITSRAAPLSSDHVSRTSLVAPRPVLEDCLDHSPTTARGLRRSLLDLCSGTASTTLRPRLGDFASRLHATGDSHTVGIFFLHLTLLQG